MKILIIDDEKDCRDDLLESLKPTNYELEIETDPLVSFEKFTNNKYDVIISDVGMRGLDGIELLKKLKKIDKKVQVIIMTAYGDLETVKSSINNKAYAFFCKPIKIDELIYKLREIEEEIDAEQENQRMFFQLREENLSLKEKFDEHIKMEEKLILSVQDEISNLYNEIEMTQKEIVYRLSEVAEMRSKETGNHVRRVAAYSEIFALEFGMDKEDVKVLKQAAPMHDIGKVAIPDNILSKKGPLTKEEFDVVKEHTTIGYQILSGSNRYILKLASIVSLEHHEKYDGTGYPKGLLGDNISAYGRIVAAADVFDALSSDRCYKKAWEIDKVVEFFKEQSGKHFDPILSKILLDNLESFLKIKEEFSDVF